MISHVIIQHIFKYFGVPNNSIFSILSDKFKLDKEISIELEDNNTIKKSVWGMTGKINSSNIKVIITDLSINNDDPEYVIILQMDELSVYALHYFPNEIIMSKVFVMHSTGTWLEISDLILAKLLVGIEQMNELFIDYKPLFIYQDIYKYMISFLNYEETSKNS